MVFIEVLISYSKLLVCFIVIGVALFYLLFRIMSGGVFYYYSRSTDFLGKNYGLLHAKSMSKKFKPVFKDVKILPLKDSLFVEGVMASNKKFKRIEKGTLQHAIFL
jgi:hypothetical protein